jgi:hypothetical protein
MKRITVFLLYLIISIGFLRAQHLKSDGTPDMRYKENKVAYSSHSYTPSASSYHSYPVPSYTGTHLKMDGTPDMRYKENKALYSGSNSSAPKTHNKSYSNPSVKRDKNGKMIRSESARLQFMKQTGYPHGRPGYVVDHIIPLKKGGCDCPSNMQWQTIEAAKAKDKWE